ncbi:MAG: glutaredoxin family protein [Planctomycetaceae bacterium]|nr:glutaredoxin family protein [Planctomycetota bacterium]NUN53092.1 glutaredoxin family protein [Planctomycetaceae bacterium]
MRVVLYGKPDCCLCDLAEAKIRGLRERGAPFDLVKVDILRDPAAEARFRDTIPAVEVDGVLVTEGRFDERALERAVGLPPRKGRRPGP